MKFKKSNSMNAGTIVLIDDDHEDLELLKDALSSLDVQNKIVTFDNASDAIQYFNESIEPLFFILCDINMPQTDGFALRRILFENERLRISTVPFLFLSTSDEYPSIYKSYCLSIQGYFVKPTSFEEMREMLKHIINYWSFSHTPGRNVV